MRVLVCGGRDYGDRQHVFDVLDGLRGKYGRLNVIQGGARGSDALAREWAFCQTSVHLSNFPAEWEKYGKAAGAIRNQQMLIEGKPDLVIAFPGGRGTADMVRRAKAAGIPVREVAAAQEKQG